MEMDKTTAAVPNPEQVVFSRPASLTTKPTHYCPGCGHGLIHRLIAQTIDELGLQERTIAICPVGCSVLMYDYLDLDFAEAAHGRASAVATGIKRVLPDRIVFAYQGDGDLAAIGTAETVHTALRGENITVVFVNNAIYGMTGGQMAPTTLEGQHTASTPNGRDIQHAGNSIRVAELLDSQDGPVYIARVAVNTPANLKKAQTAIKTAFRVQMENLGFAFVEVLSACPTNWGLKPIEAQAWINDHMIPRYPLGVLRETEAVKNLNK
jgi:2-oxoglutarate ferredoxin oxidoreductase subunit beta